MNDQSPPPAEEPQARRLHPDYDVCLLGATVDLHNPDRFVYSLKKLIRFRMRETKQPAETCRDEIATMVIGIQREHGPLAPVFVNDELVLGPAEDKKPGIILPGMNGFRHPPKKR